MSETEVVIVDGVRTPMAEYNGAFSEISAIDLAVVAAKGLFARVPFAPDEVDHVIVGNALQTSGDAIYGARHVGLKSGVPVPVPAVTVNRLCGSGIESIIQGTQRIRLGEARTVLAGGMENLSQAPHVIRGARRGFKLGQGQLEDALMVSLMDSYCGYYMAQTSDNLARQIGITRAEQDDYALSSQLRAAAALAAGKFADEIVAVPVKGRKGPENFERDDHMRPETTLEELAKLPPAFGKDGMVTAGNASGIVDGAAMVLLTTAALALEKGARPLARVIDWHVVGVLPELMGIGPAPAIRGLLEKRGMALAEIGLFEINEAFAGQILGVVRDLGLDLDTLNVNGGAIALGHPLAATGTRLTLTLAKELRRRGKRWGIASACIGGGQGIALLIEAL